MLESLDRGEAGGTVDREAVAVVRLGVPVNWRGEVVGCYAQDGREVARGLVNYGAQDAARIARKPSAEIEAILGYVDEAELIHRDNLVLL